ncbi:hypothetical protein [Acidithiobacillus sulfurivorans]|uniref:Uncharacterized protein n=1 Tax=Acidithiobacillus sulfurivorans TaxID=1958756 RepID=A0ABS6A2Q7_9PROT|nr:hypothetical protein [Acidithiobacillus sulfurivorans]MBU2761163.1 hypothetical protein [Acidithiobacillus sulfurivorans]
MSAQDKNNPGKPSQNWGQDLDYQMQEAPKVNEMTVAMEKMEKTEISRGKIPLNDQITQGMQGLHGETSNLLATASETEDEEPEQAPEK